MNKIEMLPSGSIFFIWSNHISYFHNHRRYSNLHQSLFHVLFFLENMRVEISAYAFDISSLVPDILFSCGNSNSLVRSHRYTWILFFHMIYPHLCVDQNKSYMIVDCISSRNDQIVCSIHQQPHDSAMKKIFIFHIDSSYRIWIWSVTILKPVSHHGINPS